MDLNNNKVGRDIAVNESGISEADLEKKIVDEIDSGNKIQYFKDYQKGTDATDLTTGAAEKQAQQNQTSTIKKES